MNKPLHLLADNFQSQLAAKCDLLVYIGSDFIQYAIIDHVQDQLKCIYDSEIVVDITGLLKNLIHTHPYLKYNYRKVNVSIETAKFTFIPTNLFIESDIYDYAKFIGATHTDQIIVNDVCKSGLKSVALIDPELKEVILSNFTAAALCTQTIAAILAAHQLFNNSEKAGLYLILRNKKLEISLIENSKLSIYNIFECHNADEFNFYLLSVLKQYPLTTENTLVVIAGTISTNDDYYNRISKYFEDIEFADTNKLVTKSMLFEELSGQEYFPLLSQNLCV